MTESEGVDFIEERDPHREVRIGHELDGLGLRAEDIVSDVAGHLNANRRTAFGQNLPPKLSRCQSPTTMRDGDSGYRRRRCPRAETPG